jgi:hypothetical protein
MPTLTPFLDPVNASPTIHATDMMILLLISLGIVFLAAVGRLLHDAFAAAVQLVVAAVVVGLLVVALSSVAIAVGYTIALQS